MELNDALRPIREEYWADVRGYVDDAIGRSSDMDDFMQCLETAIDGSYWVMGAQAAQAAVLVSDHDGYAIDEWGADILVRDGAIKWSTLAAGALLGDAWAYAWAALADRTCHRCGEYVFGDLPERPQPAPGERVVLTCDACADAREGE